MCFFVICYLANCFQSAFPWDFADYIEFFMLELNCISNRAKNKRWLFICQPLFPRFFSWTSRFIFCRSAFVCSPNFCCLPKKLSLLGNLEDPFWYLPKKFIHELIQIYCKMPISFPDLSTIFLCPLFLLQLFNSQPWRMSQNSFAIYFVWILVFVTGIF